MNARTAALLEDYASSHRHPTNRLTHKIAIPIIVLNAVAMLDWITLARLPIPGGRLTLAMVAYLLVAIWYLRADVKIGSMVLLVMAAFIPLGRSLTVPMVIALGVVGWAIQMAGHYVWEKKSPSFMTNLVHALVGPLFFLAVLTGQYRIRGTAGAAAQQA